MSSENQELSSTLRAVERLSATQFQDELRRVAHFRPQVVSANPLAEAVTIIEQNPAYAQSRLLARVLVALAHEQGEFRRAEIAAFDARMHAVVLALMSARATGKYTADEWTDAVNATTATQLESAG